MLSFKKSSDESGFSRVNSRLTAQLSHETIDADVQDLSATYSIHALSPMRYSMFAPISEAKLSLVDGVLFLKCKLSVWVLLPIIVASIFALVLSLKGDLSIQDAVVLSGLALFIAGLMILTSYVKIRRMFLRD